ncbi:uncharacterized protein LOC126559462 [Anopheles maculipalpis]|uniref:uncharacterized protein LOC126559462 n=1 Tax=Anopheles maculipalpis TaxID=1496333 RepID=UPI002159A8DB|nr:uncharacterized protein LOC126559462 [Anopheles maculipalpis]
MKLPSTLLALTAILTLYAPAVSACNFGLGSRVRGENVLATITVTKRANEGPENLIMQLDYKASPLINQEITYAAIRTESSTSCRFSYPATNNSKRVQATLESTVPISEMVVTMTVYGFNWA